MIRAVLLVAPVLAWTSSDATGIAASDLTCPSGSTLTYESFGAAVLSDNCLSCHATKQSPALTTQAAVQANRTAIISAAVTSSRMPQNGSLAIEERQLLGEWLTCGAP